MLLCSFEIEPYLLQVVLPLLPSSTSDLLVVGTIVVVIMAAESSSLYYSPIVNLSGSSIQDCTCWNSVFDSY